ncbi:MAG: nucleoid-associated protein [Bacteroidota bacterium]|nr:nucleoid-associated protein [Bacteroidota bacterium]
MVSFEESILGNLIVHKVGSRHQEDGIQFSEKPTNISGKIIRDLLLNYFLSSFKEESFRHFFHDTDLDLNEVYNYARKIFEDEQSLAEQSKNLAKHLYENSDHPKIQAGEFYTVIIKNCLIEDEITDAIGIFKTENKDKFLKIEEKENNFLPNYEEGININKLDKGCLIFNTEKENGYLLKVIDNTNKSKEAQYWTDKFLKTKVREDNYYHTSSYLSMCKTFADNELKDIEKTDRMALKNDAFEYFSKNDEFNSEEFAEEVIANDEINERFKNYKESFAETHQVSVSEDFDISGGAVKKQKRKFKSVLKLDKNFHIYVHGDRNLIKKGFDNEKNKNYYTIYFDKES